VTLELDQMLEIYAHFATARVNFSSLTFERDGRYHRITLCEQAVHTYQFPIGIGGERLGLLTYQALLPLAPPQLEKLKKLHRKLAFPLRNAIHFDTLRQQALTDNLTGVGNRPAFEGALRRAIEQSRRTELSLGLLLLDLDNFKQLNDRQGHLAGDAVLADFAALLQQSIRATDAAFRIGGDEFVVILYDAHEDAPSLIHRRLQKGLVEHKVLAQSGIGVSLGHTQLRPGDDVRRLYGRADEALYAAKAAGKNCLMCS